MAEILPGIYLDVPDDEYRAWPYPSYSLLSAFRDEGLCELDVEYRMANPTETTPQMELGTMVEIATHNPDVLMGNVEPLPDDIKQRRGKRWEALQEEYPGIEFLPQYEYQKWLSGVRQAVDMAEAVKAYPLTAKLIEGAQRQVSFIWDATFRGASGAPVTHRVKGRLDYLNTEKDIIVDLKTGARGGQRAFGRSLWQYAYDVQSSLYTDAMNSLRGKTHRFYFAVVRSTPPYPVTVYNGHQTTEQQQPDTLLNIGRFAYQQYLEQLSECRSTGYWRGYFAPDAPDGLILDIMLPPWAV